MTSGKVMDCVNLVELCGVIVHKYNAGKWLVLTLATALNQPKRDYPKVYWYDEFVQDVDANYQVGDRVEITGRLRTSKAYPDQSIVGLSISPVSSWIDTKFSGDESEYKPDKNEVLLKGEFIRSFTPNPDLAVVTLKTVINGYTYFPRITCFGRQAERAANIQEGATVYFVAHIQTNKKETEDGTQHYQSVVCRNMRVS